MPNFPKINDKFYAAGKSLPSLRAAVERVGQMEAENEKIPPKPGADYGALRDDFESKSFSLVIGTIDGLLARR